MLDLNKDSKDATEGRAVQEDDGVHRDLKENKNIDSANKKIIAKITRMQENARRKLADDRTKLWSQLDENLEQLKDDLEKADEKRQGNENQNEKEISNHKTLQTMSQMAQKIDEDNQILMKKNQELKIQYLSQENDRELLLKQIIYYKKESQKVKEQHDSLKRKVEEARSEERQQDEMLS